MDECCCGGSSCGFSDSDFSANVWSDPDEMIVNGEVQGTLDTEHTRVTTPIVFPASGSFRLVARISVSDGSSNWAGMEVVDANGYNATLIVESTGAAGTSVIVRDHGTADKESNAEYLIVIEYLIGDLAAPVINFWVNDELVDSQLATGISETGLLRLTAFQSARILGLSIECPPISAGQCDLWCPVGMDVNAIWFPGASDLLRPPLVWQVVNSPINARIKFPTSQAGESNTPAATSCLWSGYFARSLFGASLGEYLEYIKFEFEMTNGTVVLFPGFPNFTTPGLKLVARMIYKTDGPGYFARGHNVPTAYFQQAVYISVIDDTEPLEVDCQSLDGTNIPLLYEYGYERDEEIGSILSVGYSGSFTAAANATLVFQP